jgi:sulfur-oxidizing protein SoxZ
MARPTIKLKATLKRGMCTLKCLINHPMETGHKINRKTGEKIPPHFIQKLYIKQNNVHTLVDASIGSAISTDPYLSFKFLNINQGDTLNVSWEDNMGRRDETSVKIR